MRRGFIYLILIIDWYSRRGLSWRLPNTLTTDFSLEAVSEAMGRFGKSEIFNTDQRNQFTSSDFTDLLKNNGIKVSMDGKGCWRDNIFVERLWKSVKYQEAYDTVAAARENLGTYLTFYNTGRPHQSLDGKTPDTFYFENLPPMKIAA